MRSTQFSPEFLDKVSLAQLVDHAAEAAQRATSETPRNARQYMCEVLIALRVVRARLAAGEGPKE